MSHKPKKKRIVISDEVEATLIGLEKELRKRGLKTFEPKRLLDFLFKEQPVRDLIDAFIEEVTPLEYRIQEALKDEEKRLRLEKLLGKPAKGGIRKEEHDEGRR